MVMPHILYPPPEVNLDLVEPGGISVLVEAGAEVEDGGAEVEAEERDNQVGYQREPRLLVKMVVVEQAYRD